MVQGYEYRHKDGTHGQWSPKPLDRCVAFVRNVQCNKTLVRVGDGSRKGKR